MNPLTRFLIVGVLCALATVLAFGQGATPPPAAAPSAYHVALNRPFAKGDSYKLSVEVKDHEDTNQGVQDETAVLTGTVRVMDVNPIGEPSVLMIHVDKAETGSKEKMQKMKLEGADVGISFPAGSPRYLRRDGQPIPEEETGLLAMVFRAPRDISPDEYLGPGKDVKPGDTWSMKKDLLAKVLYGKALDPKSAPDLTKQEASVTFVGVETWDGIPCYRLRCKIALKNPENPHFIGDFLTEINQDLVLPVDKASTKSKKTWEMVTDVRGYQITQDGQKIEMRGKSKMNIDTIVQ